MFARKGTPINFTHVIDRHRKQLLCIVGTMFAMLGLEDGVPVEKFARPVCLAVLRLLRPAESAVRRLIVAAASGLVVRPAKARPAAARPVINRNPRSQRRVMFKLFDPRQRFNTGYRCRRHPKPADFNRPQPRIRLLGDVFDPRAPMFRNPAPLPPPPAPEPDDTISALRLSRRLIAIKSALEDLPRQALRYARWQARPRETRRPQLSSALRPGRPPGHRKKPIHKVDEILTECDWLARHASRPDTS